MRLKLYTAFEDIFLIIWGLVLIGILLGESCPVRFIAETHPAKLQAFPMLMTMLFSRLRRGGKSSCGDRTRPGKEEKS